MVLDPMAQGCVSVLWFFHAGELQAELLSTNIIIKVFKNCQAKPCAPILLDERHAEEENVSFTSWSELGQDLNKYLSYFPDIPLPFPLFSSC